MKINWTVRKSAGLTISAYLFANVNRLIHDIRESGRVTFTVRHQTKTSLNINISCPKEGSCHEFGVGYIPPGAEKFKFHEKVSRGVFDAKQTVRHHFRISRTQGLPELKEYLSLVLEHHLPDVQELDAEIILYKVPELEPKTLFFFHGSLSVLQLVETRLPNTLTPFTFKAGALSAAQMLAEKEYGEGFEYDLDLVIVPNVTDISCGETVRQLVEELGLTDEKLSEHDGSGNAQGWTAITV